MKKGKPVAKSAKKARTKNSLPGDGKRVPERAQRETDNVKPALRAAIKRAIRKPDISSREEVENAIARALREKLQDKSNRLRSYTTPWGDQALALEYKLYAPTQDEMRAKLAAVKEKMLTDIERWNKWRQHPDLIARVDEAWERLDNDFDRPRLEALRSNFPEYPLELLANVAAHLLDGRNYIEAVGRAFALLDACSSHLNHVESRKQFELERVMGAPKFRTVVLDKALRQITGTDNATDATSYYREFLQKARFKEMTKEEAEAASAKELERRRKDRFTPYEVRCQRQEYLTAFPKRRPKPRKR